MLMLILHQDALILLDKPVHVQALELIQRSLLVLTHQDNLHLTSAQETMLTQQQPTMDVFLMIKVPQKSAEEALLSLHPALALLQPHAHH